MIISHLTGNIEPDSGGPAYSIPMLCETLRDQGHIVDLMTLRGSNEHLVTTQHRSFPVWNFSGKLGHAPEMWRWLKQSIKTSRPDILHSHNLWALPSIYPAIAGARWSIPHIVSPRGTLTRYSMSTGSRIKRVYWPFIQRPVLKKVAAFHATAESELEDIRRLGFKQPVAVIPNGIEIHPVPSPTTGIDPSKTILYFGRFHPEKGLADLLLAWEIASSERPDWSLLLVGPDNVAYRAELERLVADRRIQGVTFEGPQYGRDKLGLYRRGAVYVLPSPSENFGMTVAEALSMEVPVIANHGAPWAGLELNQCGWWIKHGTSSLAAALIQVMQTTPAELKAMGARGRVWMKAEYSWPEIGKQMQSFYSFMLGQETKPEFVHLN
jgi:glycosyltransferase involved in cell wall biosynthesis